MVCFAVRTGSHTAAAITDPSTFGRNPDPNTGLRRAQGQALAAARLPHGPAPLARVLLPRGARRAQLRQDGGEPHLQADPLGAVSHFSLRPACLWLVGWCIDRSNERTVTVTATGTLPPTHTNDSNEELLKAWEEARTGYPFIDACMTQLREEGWIHHLARHSVRRLCVMSRVCMCMHVNGQSSLFFLNHRHTYPTNDIDRNTAGLLPHAGGPVAVVGGGGAGLRDLPARRGLEPQHGELALALGLGLLLPGWVGVGIMHVWPQRMRLLQDRIGDILNDRHLTHTHTYACTRAVLPRVQPRGLRAEDRQGTLFDVYAPSPNPPTID